MIAQKYFVIQDGMQNSTIATLKMETCADSGMDSGHGNRVKLKIATTIEKFNHYLRMLKGWRQ